MPNRPHYTVIENIKTHTYHEQKAVEDALKKPTRGLPLKLKNKPEFNSHIGKIDVFSNPEIHESEKNKKNQKKFNQSYMVYFFWSKRRRVQRIKRKE